MLGIRPRTALRAALSLALTLLALTGCALIEPAVAPTAEPVALTPSPTISPPTATPTPAPTVDTDLTLRFWVPPEFAPDDLSEGGQQLQGQLADFAAATADVASVEVRVKRNSGQGGMLDFLSTAALAAPDVMPDLVLLNQANFTQAAREARLQPLDDALSTDRLAQNYPFALSSAQVSGEIFGWPLLATTSIMVYNTAVYPDPPATWPAILDNTGPLVFPAGSPQGETLLLLYLAAGGRLQSDTGELLPDVAALNDALSFLSESNTTGILYLGTLSYATNSETWQAYRENRATLAFTASQPYLLERDLVVNTSATGIPGPTQAGRALTRTWYLALTTDDPRRQAAALALADTLLDPGFLANWSLALGYLPLQRDATALWASDPALSFAAPLLETAVLQPDAATVGEIGPVLQQAVSDVLLERSTPQDAATTIVETLADRE